MVASLNRVVALMSDLVKDRPRVCMIKGFRQGKDWGCEKGKCEYVAGGTELHNLFSSYRAVSETFRPAIIGFHEAAGNARRVNSRSSAKEFHISRLQ